MSDLGQPRRSLSETFLRLKDSANAAAALLIGLAALAGSLPRLLNGISCGHDFDFHLISWLETQRNWSQHILYPHWAQTPNWGAGEPRFLFYPPLSWMLGAALGYLINWYWTPAVFTFLCLAGSGFATRALAKKFLPPANATLAGMLACATPYGLFVAYERSALSELAASVWIPLLLLLAFENGSRTGIETGPAFPNQSAAALSQSTCLLSLVLAAVWLTNAPAGVMASYLLVFASLTSAWLQRSWKPIVRGMIGTSIGLDLAAFYLVPAAWEQRWIAISQALDVGMRVRDSWLFARHNNPSLALHDQVLLYASVLFVATTLMAAAGFLITLRAGKLVSQAKYLWLPLALLIPILLLLQLPISAPLWHLPKLEFLQFPWRWLLVLATPYAIFCAAATPLGTKRARIGAAAFWICTLLLLVSIASHSFVQFCDEEDQVSNQISIFSDGSGMLGTDEYAPTGADNSLVASGLPDGCLVTDPTQQLGESDTDASPEWYPEQGSCDDTYTAQLWKTEDKLLQVDSDHDGYVVLRLRRYPAWKTTVNGRPLPAGVPLRDDGLILAPIRQGLSRIEVHWTTTPDVFWGRWISLAASLLLTLISIPYWVAKWQRKSPRLS